MAEQDEEGEFRAESPAAREWKCILGGKTMRGAYLSIYSCTDIGHVRAYVSKPTCLQWMAHCLWLGKCPAWSISMPLLHAWQLDRSLVLPMLLCSLTLFPLRPATLPKKAPQMRDYSLIFPQWVARTGGEEGSPQASCSGGKLIQL